MSGFTQGTLYTTTTVYGVLVHQEGAICTTKAQYAPRCTWETKFEGQGHRSKVKVTRSKKFFGVEEATEEYDCTDTMRGVFKAYAVFFI